MCDNVVILTFARRAELSSIWTKGIQTTTSGSRVQPVNEIVYPGVSRNSQVGSTDHIVSRLQEGRNTTVHVRIRLVFKSHE